MERVMRGHGKGYERSWKRVMRGHGKGYERSWKGL
jgi:hypothetical protein